MLAAAKPRNRLHCTFRGKSQHEVRKLIAGPTVFICDECVELCMDIIREENKSSLELKWAEQMVSGRPFLEVHREFRNRDVQNVSISYCFNCNEMCLWVCDQLVWPRRAGVQSQSSTPRLTCGASTRRQARHWRHRRAAQPLFFVWR